MIKKLFSYLFILINGLVYSQNIDERFKHYTIDNGLAQSTVNCILQDSKGFMWIGTQSGLSKYNGVKFETFQYDLKDTNTITYNWIYSLNEDSYGNLWIATREGLNKMNLNNGQITRYTHNSSNPNSISDNMVLGLYIDKNNIIWSITKKALNRFDRKIGKFKSYNFNERLLQFDDNVSTKIIEDRNGLLWIGSFNGLISFNKNNEKFDFYLNKNNFNLSSEKITALIEDKKGNLWVGTQNGLNKYNFKTKNTQYFFHINKKSIVDNYITFLMFDKNTNLWIGTKNGISKLHSYNNDFENYLHNEININSLSTNSINSIYEDIANNLWIGTENNGVDKIDLKPKKFLTLNSNNGLTLSDIASVYEDEKNILWIGTWGGGLNLYNRKTGEVQLYSTKQTGNYKISNDEIHVIFKDSKKRIWIGTKTDVSIYDQEKKRFVSINKIYKNCKINGRVNSIIEDRNNNIWIGTSNGLHTLNIDNKFKKTFFKIEGDNTTLNSNFIYAVYEDNEGIIWIGTVSGGLNKYNPKEKKFKYFLPNPKITNSLSSSSIYFIKEISDGTIVLCTMNGLNFFNKKTEQFSYLNKKMGLPENETYGFIEDNSKNLWISTNRGLSKYDLNTRTFKNFDQDDGLQSMEFNFGAFYKNCDGELFFGGIKGLNYFKPERILNNPNIPKVLITKIKKNNNNGEQIIPLNNSKNIELTYQENMLTIEFTSLDFTNPEKNCYKYKLEGMVNDWVELGNRSFVTFSNLPSGEYLFRVTGSNNDQVWNEEGVSLKIIVNPPYWKSIWAYLIYIILIILFTYWRIRKTRKEKIRLKEKIEIKTRLLHQRNIELEIQTEDTISKSEKLKEINSELEKLSIVASKTSNAITIMDAEGNIKWINESYTKIYGYNLDELVSMKGKKLTQVSSNPQINGIIYKCIFTKSSVVFDSSCINKDGKKVWFQTTLTPILDKNNNIKNLVTIDSDISELKIAEEQIVNQKSELEKSFHNIKLLSEIGIDITSNLLIDRIIEIVYLKVNSLMDASFFAIGIHNSETDSIDVNGAKEKGETLTFHSYKLSDKDRLGVWCFHNQKEVFINNAKEIFKYIKVDQPPIAGEETESIIYYPLTLKKRKLGVISVQSFNKNAYTENNLNIIKNLAVYVSIALDNAQAYFQIEDQKEKIETTLHELQQTQSQLIQSEKMAALGQLIAGVAHEINTPLGAIKSSVGNISDTLNQELKKWPEFFKQISPKNLTIIFYLLEISLKKDLNISSKDERKLKKDISTKLETLNILEPAIYADILVDIGIYEINDTVAILLKEINCKEILIMLYKMSGLFRSSQTIQTATDRASKIVFALKNFAHFDNTGESVKANITIGIDTVLTLYHHTLKHGIEVIKNYNEVPDIYCFPDELNQVWTNVIHNAIQAMDNKGTLTIEVCQISDEKNSLTTTDKTVNEIQVSFKDTGCGIPFEIKEKIFEPFFTTKKAGEGSGLGLDIVKSIISKHNGKIKVESEPGNTKFSVFIPISENNILRKTNKNNE